MCQMLISQEVNQVTKDAKGHEKMLGEITKDGFTSNSFNAWFTPNYEAYQPDAIIVKKLQRKLKKYTITIFMGTWCEDSQREVPHFYKILDAMNVAKEDVELIAVDEEKVTPNRLEDGFDITYVPTFIFYRNGKEINRIVESPVNSLEEDMLTILSGDDYKHTYAE